MKRLLLAAVCVAAMLTTACEKSFNDVSVSGGKAATLSVNIGLPEMSTRAFADGTTATELQYAVYEVTDQGHTKIVGDGYAGKKPISLRTDISFTLLKNHKYGLVFWAAAPSNDEWTNPYKATFDTNGAEVVFYDEAYTGEANDDSFDAFYAYQEVEITGDSSVSVQLYRPFAQINIGTNDYDKAQVLGIDTESLSSYVEIPVPGSLNLITGELNPEHAVGNVKIHWSSVPRNETYPVNGCKYLAMAYVLVGKEQETINLKFGYSNTSGVETTRTIGSVPVQRNYRTNIYGALLTSNIDVNVDIEPDTDGNKKVMLTWDGKTMNEPAYDASSHTYTVNGADELAWLASQTDTDYKGETIVLENDLNLAGHEFLAFASGAERSSSTTKGTSFSGVFDGKGKTISNAKVVVENSSKDHAAGFFASVAGSGAAVKNITFENIEIIDETAEQAGVVGIVSDGAAIENIKVMGGTIKSKQAAGGIVGRVLKNGTVKNCENHANVSTTAHNVGGIVGAAYYNNEGMTIIGCDNYGNISGQYGVGGIVGFNTGDVTDCKNYGKSVECANASVGGIVGEQHASGSITGCTNYANVSGGDGKNATYGAGGIVGWVRYDSNANNYPNLEPITVSGCTNEGKHINGVTGVGGIVGMWYCDGVCTDNINLAESITASGSFVASIVGGTQWTEICSDRTQNYGDKKLKVTYNTTYTAEEKITGDCKAEFIYDNTGGTYTVIEKNKTAAMTTVGSADDFKSAFADIQDGDIIVLSDGDFDCKTITWPKNGIAVTIKGNGEDSKLTNLGYVDTNGCDLTLENLNLFVEKGGSSTSFGFQNAKSVTLKSVKVMGEFHTFSAETAVFEGCYFVHDGVNTADRQGVWCDGYGKTVIKDCVFEVIPPATGGNETKAILIYSTTNTAMGDVEVTNCTFKPGLKSAKACVEIHSEKFQSAGTVTITGCTWDKNTYEGGLWREIYNVNDDNHKKGDKTSFYTVYVDGQLAQTGNEGNN